MPPALQRPPTAGRAPGERWGWQSGHCLKRDALAVPELPVVLAGAQPSRGCGSTGVCSAHGPMG